jgi:PadR family transcriptional regulator, regulatory protein AphA
MTTPNGKPRAGWSTTSYALLGLLSLRSWTTYELAKQVQRSLNWFWPRAERKLYDEPKRLASAGLATAAASHTGLRPRTVYAITDEGRQALQHWLGEPSAPRTSEFEAMLKVFFADAGSLEQLDATLAAIEREVDERLRALAGMVEQGLAGQAPFPERLHVTALTIRLSAAQEHAVLDWARWAREQLPAWRSTTDPGRWDTRAALRELSGSTAPPGPAGL